MGTVAPKSARNARIRKVRLGPVLLVVVSLLSAPLSPVAPARCASPSAGMTSIEELWSGGETAFKAGDLDEALRRFEAALAGDPQRARSWNYVGGVYFARGEFARALENFRKALELDPGDVRACNNFGTALERLGNYEQARKAYERAVLIDPKYPLTQRNLGILESRRPETMAAARRAWQRYLELAPTGAYADEIRRELAAPDAPPPPAPALTAPALPAR